MSDGRVPCPVNVALFDRCLPSRLAPPTGGTPPTIPTYHVVFDKDKRPTCCYHCGSAGLADAERDGQYETVCLICSRSQCWWTGRR